MYQFKNHCQAILRVTAGPCMDLLGDAFFIPILHLKNAKSCCENLVSQIAVGCFSFKKIDNTVYREDKKDFKTTHTNFSFPNSCYAQRYL
jgi:hypothetical protein